MTELKQKAQKVLESSATELEGLFGEVEEPDLGWEWKSSEKEKEDEDEDERKRG